MTGNRTLIAFSAAFVLCLLGAASVAQASNENDGDRGGFVVPGSTVGVNPAYHRGQRVTARRTGGGSAYGYAVQRHHSAR